MGGGVRASARPGVRDSSPANIRIAVEGSPSRLGTDYIDLLYQHGVDPGTRIEDSVCALAELVATITRLPPEAESPWVVWRLQAEERVGTAVLVRRRAEEKALVRAESGGSRPTQKNALDDWDGAHKKQRDSDPKVAGVASSNPGPACLGQLVVLDGLGRTGLRWCRGPTGQQAQRFVR
jgi:Aldo/keto reductase family